MKLWKQREMFFGGVILIFIVLFKFDLIFWILYICFQFDINEIIFVIIFIVVLEMFSDGFYYICKLCIYYLLFKYLYVNFVV